MRIPTVRGVGFRAIVVEPITVGQPSLPSVPYVWRDPKRLTAGQLAALADLDDQIAGTGAYATPTAATRAEATAANRRQFAGLRASGMSVPEAARHVGVSERTGLRYQAEIRKENQQ